MSKRLVALFGVALIVLTACQPAATTGPTTTLAPGETPGPTTEGGLAADQVLHIAGNFDVDPRSLEPQAASGSDEILLIDLMQRGLLYIDHDSKVVPSLATELPTVSDDGKTFTFTLRDAKYSNDEPIVAGDFVRAFRRLADPRNAFDYGYEMCPVVGANEVLGADFGCEGETPYLDPAAGTFDDAKIDALLDKLGAEAPDDKTFVVHLTKPLVFFPNIMAMWLTVPVQESWTKFAEASDLVASGPFKMSEWTHNSTMTFVPNPNWYGTKPTLTEIDVLFGEPSAMVAAYEAGQLDTVWVPGTDTRRVGDDPNLKEQIKDNVQLGISYYDFSECQAKDSAGKILCPKNSATQDGLSPSANKNFRIALSQAVDKKEIIDVAWGGLGVVANGSVMPGIPGWPDDYDPYPFDVASAKTHLNTAMDELGIPAVTPEAATADCDAACQEEAARVARVQQIGRMKFGYNCNAGHEGRVFYLYDTWRNSLGFGGQQFDISCTDFGTFRTERRAGNIYDISRNGWGADFPHPDNQLRDLFACGAGNNNSKYCNPQFDELLDQASTTLDETASHDLYVKAQRLLVDDAPVLFLRYDVSRFLVQPYLSGLFPTAQDTYTYGRYFPEEIKILEH